MELRKHYFMTCAALFFLGIIVAKPGSSFYPAKENRECKLTKGKMECIYKNQEYKMNDSIRYVYQ